MRARVSSNTVAGPRLQPFLRRLGLLCVLGLGLGAFGCGSLKDTMRGLGHSAMQGVSDGVPGLKEPLQKTLRETLLGDDLLQQSAQRITAATLRSLETGLADPKLQARIDELIAGALKVVGEKGGLAAQQLLHTAGPELKDALRQVVLQTVAAASGALRDAVQKDLTEATQQMARGTAEALAAALVKALDGPLGQRLQQTAGQMGQRLASEATAGLSHPASKAAVSEFTHSAAYGALSGARAGLSEGLPDRLQVALITGSVLLGTLVLLLTVGLIALFRRYRHSTRSLAIIAEKINQHDARELKQAIKRSAEDNYVGPWLSGFLKERGL